VRARVWSGPDVVFASVLWGETEGEWRERIPDETPIKGEAGVITRLAESVA